MLLRSGRPNNECMDSLFYSWHDNRWHLSVWRDFPKVNFSKGLLLKALFVCLACLSLQPESLIIVTQKEFFKIFKYIPFS